MITLYTDTVSDPWLDTAVSHSLVRAVGRGELGESLRIYRPEPIVAFGKRDAVTPGFAKAVEATRQAGFEAVIRLAGGRAAVFHEDTIAFAWAVPHPTPRDQIRERFEIIAAIVVDAANSLGADARVGEIPGEYCPGEYSVNVAGEHKVMGVGQRIISGAAHIGGVLVVDGGSRIADVLNPVYDALDLWWDPKTSGDLAGAVLGLTWQRTYEALVASFERHGELEHQPLPEWIVGDAHHLAIDHRP